MPEGADASEVEGRIDAPQMVDRSGGIGERARPAAAGADRAVVDVPRRPSTPHQVTDQPAHDELAVARLPGATVDHDHHWMWAGTNRQVKLGALQVVWSVAMTTSRPEEVDQQARDCGHDRNPDSTPAAPGRSRRGRSVRMAARWTSTSPANTS
ncbi:MAG: hypothetical protein E6G62_02930 [Actinobacteria bacterium]|nr:MAG: hypothetical protein E6G62_02930 [Actinomycetota bacterium]